MTPFLSYIARAGLYLGLFYAFYLLFMRRTTFFRLNRVLLLAGSYLCLLLPLIRLRSGSATEITSELTIAGIGTEAGALELQSTIPWKEVLLAIYVIGTLITLALFLISAGKMHQTIRKGVSTKRDDCMLVILEEDAPSFSWGRKVVMSRKDLQENPAIFTHELMHVQCRHSRDLVLFMPLQIIFWWNPLVWITREELRLLHEYEADEGVIKQGIDASQYQLLLVRKAVGEHRFSLASGFQHAKLKNRITMMLKPASSCWIHCSYLALIAVLAVFMFACNPARKGKELAPKAIEQEAIPFSLIQKKPTFNGGDDNEFSKWVNSQLHYPEQAIRDGVQGRVTLQFTIDADGEMRDVKVLRGVREDLDAEALRVISSSPKWEPGVQEGKAVPVTYTFPVVYRLK